MLGPCNTKRAIIYWSNASLDINLKTALQTSIHLFCTKVVRLEMHICE